MSERVDAPSPEGSGDNEGRGSRPEMGSGDPRALGAMMYRATSLRPKRRLPFSAATGLLLGGVYLPPSLRRALAALLRGDYVSPQERAALAHAVALATGKTAEREQRDPWSGLEEAANSNFPLPFRVRRWQPQPDPSDPEGKGDNPILRDLGFEAEPPEEN
jgi:hypothetical protein